MLSEHWNNADVLNRLVSHDKGFNSFVLHHIDELMSPEQAATIGNNSESQCPANANTLCRETKARIKKIRG